MKKLTILSILFISLAFVAPTQASVATSAGVKPDSFFYSFDLLGEKISLFFTRDPYEKAKKGILFADERIAEIKASEDNQKAALKATNEFAKDISLSFESFDKIKEDAKKVGFLVSFENRYKEHWGALSSLYDNLPQEEQPTFRENLVAYASKLQRGLDEVHNIMNKKSEPLVSDTGSDSKNVSDELADIKKQIALLIKQQSVTRTTPINPSVGTLKAENPQQYKNLVSENKSQLVEASKLLSNKNIISKVKPSVVFIETSTGSGSGIVIESNGYVLTNAHVVSSVNSATIKFANGQSYTGTVAGRDEDIDLALLKADATNLTPANLGNSDLVEQGDSVFTFGYPLGIEGDVAFKDGTLSRRQKIDGATYLEISAQILPGNSGGPLVNQSGEVIGVNTLALGASKIGGVLIGETLKYAIPINVVKGIILELKNGRNIVTPKPSITIPTPSPTPNPSQPILPPSIFTPTPEQKPEPIRTTISNVKAEESSGGIVTISWNTNKVLAYSKILIGADSQLNNAKEINGQTSWMTVLPSDYEYVPNTTYYYQVAIREYGSLNYDPIEAKSPILSFTTKPSLVTPSLTTTPAPTPIADTTPPVISNIKVSNIKSRSATFSWTTDEPASSRIYIGAGSDDVNQSLYYHGNLTTNHDITSGRKELQGEENYWSGDLQEGTVYYRIVAWDEKGNESKSQTLSFQTATVGSLSVSSMPFSNSTLTASSNVDSEAFKIRMTASADENIKISKIVVAADCDLFEFISLYVDGINNPDGRFHLYYGNGVVFNLNTPVIISAGKYKDFVIKVTTKGSGGECRLNLQTTGDNKYNIDAIGMLSDAQIYITASEPLLGSLWTIQ